MLDKKTKEELMQLPKEEIIEVYEVLYELYDELGDRIKRAIEYTHYNHVHYGKNDEDFIDVTGLFNILYKGDK